MAKATSSVRALATAAAALFAVAALPAPQVQAAEVFNNLKGSWSGGGRASFTGGQTEKLRCTARYSGNSANLSVALRCASASAQINMTGSLDGAGNRVSGDWSESNFGLSGSASGSASASGVRLRISGGMQGYMTLSVAGDHHTVAVSSNNTTLTGVNVSLSRR